MLRIPPPTFQRGFIVSDKPMAAEGLISYRVKSDYGWVMIGAKNDSDAWSEARRSIDKPCDLQVWNGERYVPIA